SFETTFDRVREKLEALPRVGANINVRGGQFPGNPIEVEFKDHLADRPIPALLVTENTMVDREGFETPVIVTVEQAGVSADGEITTIPPEDFHFAETAIDNIKPVTTIISLGRGPGFTKRQLANAVAS